MAAAEEATWGKVWEQLQVLFWSYAGDLGPPLTPLTGSTVDRAQQINLEIEALVRECPTQYLWGYNRYKHPGGAEPPPPA